MKLRIDDFIIKSSRETIHFDLFKDKKFKDGKNKGKHYEENVAWSVPMERCFKHIISDRLDVNKDTMDLDGFLIQYRIISEGVLSEFKKLKK